MWKIILCFFFCTGIYYIILKQLKSAPRVENMEVLKGALYTTLVPVFTISLMVRSLFSGSTSIYEQPEKLLLQYLLILTLVHPISLIAAAVFSKRFSFLKGAIIATGIQWLLVGIPVGCFFMMCAKSLTPT